MSFYTVLVLVLATFLAWVFAVGIHRDRRRAGLSEEGRRIQDRAVLDARNARREMRVQNRMAGGNLGATLHSLRDRD